MSDGMTPLPDTWTNRDLPFLRLVAEDIEANGPYVKTVDIGAKLGFDMAKTNVVARALESGGYVSKLSWAGNVCPSIYGVTDKARRAVGLWPSREVGYERLLAKLDELIEASTPEERTRLQRVRDAVVSGGGQLGLALAGAALGNVAGL